MGKERQQGTLVEALQYLSQKQGQEIVQSITPIIRINDERGRIDRWLQGGERTIEMYVDMVASNYRCNRQYLCDIQEARTEEVWEPLFKQLKKWAYNYLLRKHFVPNSETYRRADEYATEAAIVLLDNHFPYDSDFEPWAYILLQNTCSRQIRSEVTQKRNPVGGFTSIEDELEKIQDENPSHEDALSQKDRHVQLREAIKQLPVKSWQTVLELRYFEGLSSEEIAEKMQKTPGAIYSLHFRAVAKLREIWMEID